MIVRILGEGKFELANSKVSQLEDLDTKLTSAVESGDETRFNSALSEIIGFVKSEGVAVSVDHFGPSDVTLPHADSTLLELQEILSQEA